MKNILKISSFLSVLLLLFTSCEKDNITTNTEELVAKGNQTETDLKQALSKSPNGWVMMVKSTLADSAYIPIVMQFDTAKNMVKMRSIYGTAVNNKSTYLISKGPNAVLLNFSGGSIISSLMRMARTYSDVTDYMFKVLSVSPDAIKIQGIKSGGRYLEEGGQIYTLFKRPDSWKWADDALLLDMKTTEAKANVNLVNGILTLNYIPTSKKVNLDLRINTDYYAQVLGSYQNLADPFYTNSSANVFDKFYLFLTTTRNNNSGNILERNTEIYNYFVTRQGHNAFFYIPFYDPSAFTALNTGNFAKSIKTPYLVINEVIRSGSNVTIKLASYDKIGKDYISAEYRNFDK